MKRIAILILFSAGVWAQGPVTTQPTCPTQPSATIQCFGTATVAKPTGILGIISTIFRKGQTVSLSMTLGYSAIPGPQGNPAIPPMTVGTVYERWPVTNNQRIMTVPVALWAQTTDAQGNAVLTVTGVPYHAGMTIEAVSQ